MGGGGGNIPTGGYGPATNWMSGTPSQQPQQGFNQSQQNYIQSQGKLPTAFGGNALTGAQQNFFNTKGYLPQGFTGGDLGQQYYKPQQQPQQQYNPWGNVSAPGGTGPNPNLFGNFKDPGGSYTGAPMQSAGFNQSQQNYIQSQGKLPSAFGGDALTGAQQNYFNTKGYLPQGFTGGNDLGQQYFKPQQQQQALSNQVGQYNPWGNVSAPGGTGPNPNLFGNYGDPGGSYKGAPIQMPGNTFGLGGFGPATNWMQGAGGGGYGQQVQQVAGSNKPQQ